MSQVLYSQLGMNKRLVDIVFAGSHDAGITSGGGNVKTQSKSLCGQAIAGVRIFDLRIIATTSKGSTGGTKRAELVTYHAQGLSSTFKKRHMVGLGTTRGLEISTYKVGTTGMSLWNILDDAKFFVTNFPSEFLILKFDKCKNWWVIAETCIARLGNAIYTGTGNLNTKTLQQLAGKVIVVFGKSGLDAIKGRYDASDGILGFQNLYSSNGTPGNFSGTFDGIQYFGKGGTNPFGFGTYNKKMNENINKQSKIMDQLSNNITPNSQDILGMMYWTSTGTFQSIKKRNEKLWKSKNVNRMRDLWSSGLRDAIHAQAQAKKVNPTQYSSGSMLKSFLPNIIMIDFADAQKCLIIYDLNKLASTLMPYYFLLEST